MTAPCPSRVERFWLACLRMAWRYRTRPVDAARLLDRWALRCGRTPLGRAAVGLFEALEAEGARYLDIEPLDRPGTTGDERDLLAALRALALGDPLGAEQALGALLPPGSGGATMNRLQAIAEAAGGGCAGRTGPAYRPAAVRRFH